MQLIYFTDEALFHECNKSKKTSRLDLAFRRSSFKCFNSLFIPSSWYIRSSGEYLPQGKYHFMAALQLIGFGLNSVGSVQTNKNTFSCLVKSSQTVKQPNSDPSPTKSLLWMIVQKNSLPANDLHLCNYRCMTYSVDKLSRSMGAVGQPKEIRFTCFNQLWVDVTTKSLYDVLLIRFTLTLKNYISVSLKRVRPH